MDRQNMFEALVENAFDFLNTALEEFDTKPKYSVIHFNAAVELFLKARLMAEHWSLLVAPRLDADAEKFERGDFQSVTMVEAAKRLEKVVGQPLSGPAFQQFSVIANHRNKMVHFFHEDTSKDAKRRALRIAGEQVRAWYFLNRLLETEWKNIFKGWESQISDVSKKLRGHHEYFRIHYEQLKPEIEKLKNRGIEISECPECGYEADRASKVLGPMIESACLVCTFDRRSLTVDCPKCNKPILFISEGIAICDCGKSIEPEELASIIEGTDDAVYGDEDSRTPAHCTRCESTNTVASCEGEYLCASCFTVYGESAIESCEYCGSFNAGSLPDSFLEGCVACEGRWGDLRDE